MGSPKRPYRIVWVGRRVLCHLAKQFYGKLLNHAHLFALTILRRYLELGSIGNGKKVC